LLSKVEVAVEGGVAALVGAAACVRGGHHAADAEAAARRQDLRQPEVPRGASRRALVLGVVPQVADRGVQQRPEVVAGEREPEPLQVQRLALVEEVASGGHGDLERRGQIEQQRLGAGGSRLLVHGRRRGVGGRLRPGGRGLRLEDALRAVGQRGGVRLREQRRHLEVRLRRVTLRRPAGGQRGERADRAERPERQRKAQQCLPRTDRSACAHARILQRPGDGA
jgi:hypothetical protein